MNNLLDKSIGTRLREARKKSGLTIENVYKTTKISKQTIINYEKGLGNPTLNNIIVLCNLYKITPNYIIFGDESTYSNISSSLKKKIYNLVSLDCDNDISYDSVKGIIIFNNLELKKYFSYCHSMFSVTRTYSKLEIIDKILKYLDSEIEE